MKTVIKGYLICDDKAASLGDCRVEASYRIKIGFVKPSLNKKGEFSAARVRSGQLSARTDNKGHFVIPLPQKISFAESSLDFSVYSPSGALIGQANVDIEALTKDIGIRVKAELTLPLFRVVLSPRFTRPFCAVPRTSVAHTASG